MYDKESGLYYMNARYYDPDIGTFMTADPAMSGLNHYAYASCNPIKYTDPTGMDWTYDDAGDATAVAEAEEASAAAISQQFGDWPAQYLAEKHSYFRSGWWNEWDWARAENTPGGRSFLAAEAAKAEREREEKEFDKHLEWQRQYLDKLDIPNNSYLSQKQIEKIFQEKEERAKDKAERAYNSVLWIFPDAVRDNHLQFRDNYGLHAGMVRELDNFRQYDDFEVIAKDIDDFKDQYGISALIDHNRDGLFEKVIFNDNSYIIAFDIELPNFKTFDSKADFYGLDPIRSWNIDQQLPNGITKP